MTTELIDNWFDTNEMATERIAESPKPDAIRYVRNRFGITQSKAARLIHSKLRTWQDWEAGVAKMHPGLWELFLLRANGYD